MLLSLVTNIIIIRKLSVSGYGVYSLILMIIGLISTFGFSWSSSSILYFGGQEKKQTGNLNKTFWARNIIILGSLIVTTVLFVLFKHQINEYIGLDVAFLILLWLYVSVAEDYLNQYFLAVNQQLLSSLLSLTAKLIFLFFVLYIPINIRLLLLINILSHSTVFIYILKINKNDIGAFEYDKAWFKKIFEFSIWQLFGFSGLYLINFGDTAIINHFMTAEDVGIYNSAYNLFNAVASFSFILINYFASDVSSYFAENDTKSLNNFYYKDRYYITIMSVLVHFIVIIFSEFIIVQMYGERYIEAVRILQILMITSMIKYWGIFYMLYYNSNKLYKLQQTLNIFRAIINIVLNVLLINLIGLIGPAIGTLVSVLSTSLFSVYYCERRINIFRKEELQ